MPDFTTDLDGGILFHHEKPLDETPAEVVVNSLPMSMIPQA